ncbi:SDR family NAD(P)-dependent oxidoreductase [Mycolicibacterium psychrotolerans]|uniref:Oxidoreductase n=1 Tax=Mycolicibacterium psychrotolerans TaxID=216929 RepID=A0A7I7MDC3_9MYCO|nr:SDR family NAD(P)-dependent oxidoreductase [Mycolicibacterium psychrotolerans]BBX70268.1 oxidoreductase [Mycolicibacterium psychrotolerans]
MSQAELALVTGASSGIGLELARNFARNGYDLVVAADDDAIHGVPAELASHGGAVQPVQVDLRTPEGVEHLFASTVEGGRTLTAAALNAGVGRGEMFLKSELSDDLSIIDLNVRSTVHLAKLVLRDMANRDSGKVLFTSSVASMMPGSYQPVYNASKSFVQSFVKALQDELRDTSITVTALLPGPTDTNFFARAKMLDSPIGKMGKDDPAEVARQGFEALMRGDRQVVAASLSSKLMGTVSRVLPDPVKAAGSRLISAPLGR